MTWPMCAAAALVFCSAPEATRSSRLVEQTVTERIDTRRLRKEPAHGYVAALQSGRPGDRNGRSRCVLLEDGKPLGPAHCLHADIRKTGRGRYSHWTRGSLYFSTSDNSDPRTNGRTYTLVSARRARRQRHTVRVRSAGATYRVAADTERPILSRRLVIRNLDERMSVVPTFRVKGRPDLTSVDGMLRSILAPKMTDEAKAVAVWRFLRDGRYHYYPAEGGDEVHDPVKFLNVYGYGFCDDSAENFAVLCRAAGLRARIWGLSGHVVGEVFYAGRWHMFDPDMQVYYRMPAGHVAGVTELAAHPEVITRAPDDAAYRAVAPVEVLRRAAGCAKLYTTTENNRARERKYAGGHRLEPTLAPGDEVVFERIGPKRVHRVLFRDKPLPPTAGNGRLTRRLDLSRAGREALVRVAWPYVLLGGELRLSLAAPDAKVAVAILDADGKERPLSAAPQGAERAFRFDEEFAEGKPAGYGCALRLAAAGRRPLCEAVRRAVVVTTFQFAPRALGRVAPGGTTFRWSVRPSGGGRLPGDWPGLEVVHEWDEVLSEAPPALPGGS